MIIIVDTNIIFAALRSKNAAYRKQLLSSEHSYYCPNFLIVEIFKHKERILIKSKADDAEVYEFLNKLQQKIHFVNESIISIGSIKEAYKLCKDVDEKDTPFIALALELKATVWTQDKKLINGISKKGFKSFVTVYPPL